MDYTNNTASWLRALVNGDYKPPKFKINSLCYVVQINFPKTFVELQTELKSSVQEELARQLVLPSDKTKIINKTRDELSRKPKTSFERQLAVAPKKTTGICDGLAGRDCVDGLILFYVRTEGFDNVKKLHKAYSAVSAGNTSDKLAKDFYDEFNDEEVMNEFFETNTKYFMENGGKFVALARCIEVFPVRNEKDQDESENDHKDTKYVKYKAKFDLSKFIELDNPIAMTALPEVDSQGRQIGKQPKGGPFKIGAEYAMKYLKLIAQANQDQFKKSSYQELAKWLQRIELSDESMYTINQETWRDKQKDIDFDDNSREDEDIRAYFTNYLVNDLSYSTSGNNVVFIERGIWRYGKKRGIADYVILMKDPTNDSYYWVPVEVKVDINNTPKPILQQASQYMFFNAFKHSYTKKAIKASSNNSHRIYMRHGVVLILDRHGVYIAKKMKMTDELPEFIENRGIGNPLWKRELFAYIDPSEIKIKLAKEIRDTLNITDDQTTSATKPVAVANSVTFLHIEDVLEQEDLEYDESEDLSSEIEDANDESDDEDTSVKYSARSTTLNTAPVVTPSTSTYKNSYSTSNNENPPARNSLFWWFMIPISLMILAYLSEYDWPIILLIPAIAIVIKNLRSVLKLIGLSIIIFVILVIVLWITYG